MARAWKGIDSNVADFKVANALRAIDVQLDELSRNLSVTVPTSVGSLTQESFLVVALTGNLTKERRLAVSSPLTATDSGPNADFTIGVSFQTPSIALAAAAGAGAANALIRSDATIRAFDDSITPLVAGVAAVGSAAFASRADHVHPAQSVATDRLTSVTATAGDTLVLTSDGTDNTLKLSRSGADLLLQDAASVTMARLFSTGGADRGLHVNGNCLIGQGTALSGGVPSDIAILQVAQNYDAGAGSLQNGFMLRPVLNADTGGNNFIGGSYEVFIADGYDPDSTATVQPQLIGHSVVLGGASTSPVWGIGLLKAVGFVSTVSLTVPAGSPASTEAIGIEVASPTISVAPTRSYGLKVLGAGTGTTAWAAAFTGRVQVATTSELGLGRANTVASTNSFRAKTSTGQIIVLKLNSADAYEWDTTFFYPATNGGAGLGKDAAGWGDLWLKDTSAAFEDRLVFTSSTALTADRTLTADVVNGSRTVKIQGNPTLDDWFDQSVKTAATPQFARIGIGNAAHATTKLRVDDNIAAPSSNLATGLINRYGGDGTYCGDPTVWLRININGADYKIPCFS